MEEAAQPRQQPAGASSIGIPQRVPFAVQHAQQLKMELAARPAKDGISTGAG